MTEPSPTEPSLVFARERDGRPELVVNFGIFSGRAATEAEVNRLGQALLEEVDSAEVVCEQRYEFDAEMEATVYQVCVQLPRDAEPRLGHFRSVIADWAADCIAERRLI